MGCVSFLADIIQSLLRAETCSLAFEICYLNYIRRQSSSPGWNIHIFLFLPLCHPPMFLSLAALYQFRPVFVCLFPSLFFLLNRLCSFSYDSPSAAGLTSSPGTYICLIYIWIGHINACICIWRFHTIIP